MRLRSQTRIDPHRPTDSSRERKREQASEREQEKDRASERASERDGEGERTAYRDVCLQRERGDEGLRVRDKKTERYTPAPGGACSTRLGRSSSKAISSGSSGVMGKSADAPIWNVPCTRRSRGQCVERCRGNPSLSLRQCCTAGGDGRSACITSRVGRSIWLEKRFRCERSLRTRPRP